MALYKAVVANSTTHQPCPTGSYLRGDQIQLSTDAGNTLTLGTDGGLVATGGGSGGSSPGSVILIAQAGANGYATDSSQVWNAGSVPFTLDIPVLAQDLTPYSHIYLEAQMNVQPTVNGATIAANQGILYSIGIYNEGTGGQFFMLPYCSSEVLPLRLKETGSRSGSVNLVSNIVDLSTRVISPTIPLVFNLNTSGVNTSTLADMNLAIPTNVSYRWKLFGIVA